MTVEPLDTDPSLQRDAQERRFSAALDRFTDGVHQSLEEAWAWAEEADKVLAEASAEILDLRHQVAELTALAAQLEDDRAKARAAVSGLSDAVRAYVTATSEGQRSLLELTRRFIRGTRPHANHEGTAVPSGDATKPARLVPHTSAPNQTEVADTDLGGLLGTRSGDHATGWPAPTGEKVHLPDITQFEFDPQTSEEHRLIDLQNHLDMNRLDVMGRLAPSRSMSRRRSG